MESDRQTGDTAVQQEVCSSRDPERLHAHDAHQGNLHHFLLTAMFELMTDNLLLCVFVLQALLKEHANDNPKLAYTGKPIVKWPPRVSLPTARNSVK